MRQVYLSNLGSRAPYLTKYFIPGLKCMRVHRLQYILIKLINDHHHILFKQQAYHNSQFMQANPKKRIGKYIIFLGEKLGFGAFSEVFKGIDEDTKEEVAVKVVNKAKIIEDEYTKNAFYSEIQINKKLKSVNIIKFYDVHETANNFYIVLELAQGGTLRSTLRKMGRLDEKRTMKYLIQILNGFGELAKNGITHRDLKPQNILIKDENLKIADFGFAKHSENNSFLKTIVGTPAYMAPQILNQQKYTYKCDIWSLGVMTYEMIVGKIPWIFTEKTLEGFKKQILNRQIVFPPDVEMSEHMREFILGCLCIDEKKRYDWEQVFLHPLFGKKFENNFHQKDTTKISFIMANLRMNLHSKNINLSKILGKLGDKLSQKDFINLMLFIHKEITEEEIILLYNCIANKDTFVYIKDFGKLLTHYQCRLTGMDLSKVQMDCQEDSSMRESKKSLTILNRLKNVIQSKNIDIGKVYQSKNLNKPDLMQIDEFSKLISHIDESISQPDLLLLFKEFDTNGDGKITYNQFYKGICKIAEIVPMEQQ